MTTRGPLHSALCTLTSDNISRTHQIAAALAEQCISGDCIALRGDLGAGKTAFARGFIQALEPAHKEILSPTFTLVQTYPVGATTLWHFDLYRLKRREEVAELGLDDALREGITLIEWPEMVEDALPEGTLDVSLAIGDNPAHRIITLAGPPSWRQRLEAVKVLAG